jgi:putative sigma-54 modulation protein
MQLQMKAKNVDLTPALKAYAEKKLGRLGRLLHDSARVELELAAERNPSIGESQIAEATVWTKGPVLRARESARDMKAAIDLLVDKLDRQAERLHDNRRRRAARAGTNHAAAPAPATDEEGRHVIVKTKQFTVKPMDAEEAIMQLELIGHDFFVFQNDETNAVNVLYRRRDGNYGLIEPQLT